MDDDNTLRQALRRETQQLHDRLDSRFADADMGDRDEYVAFLAMQYAARAPVERWLNGFGDEAPVPSSLPLLEADLRALGRALPDEAPFSPPTRGDATGAIWALAGSSLGNAMMRKQVMRANPDLPTAFLSDGALPRFWRDIRPTLDTVVDPDREERAVASAREVFRCFLAAATRPNNKTENQKVAGTA